MYQSIVNAYSRLFHKKNRTGTAPLQQTTPSNTKGLYVKLAENKKEIVAAQKLRYRVFTQEYGAVIKSLKGIDKDRFDLHCRHIIVKDKSNEKVVGCTRILSKEQAIKTKGFYASTEFYMAPINELKGSVMEIGRTCIHPDYRNNGTAITMLWSKLTEVFIKEKFDFLIGCASVSLADKGKTASVILKHIEDNQLKTYRQLVEPRAPLMLEAMNISKSISSPVVMPNLLKTYLKMGARVCGEPNLDKVFNVADFMMLLDVKDFPRRYINYFLRI